MTQKENSCPNIASNYLLSSLGASALYLINPPRDASNILNPDERKLWLSSSRATFPHCLLVDMSALEAKPEFFRYFGISCWHAYSSNPKRVRLRVSGDGEEFIDWQLIETELRSGLQIFKLKEKLRGNQLRFMRIEIEETHGEVGKTYLNQICLYEKLDKDLEKYYVKQNAIRKRNPQTTSSLQGISSTNQSYLDDALSQNAFSSFPNNHIYLQDMASQQFFSSQENPQPLSPQTYLPHGHNQSMDSLYDPTALPMHSKSHSTATGLSAPQIQQNPYFQRVSALEQQLGALQEQAISQNQLIQEMEQYLENSHREFEVQEFLDGMRQAYQLLQEQIAQLKQQMDAFYTTVFYSQSQLHQRVGSQVRFRDSVSSQHQPQQQTSCFRCNLKEEIKDDGQEEQETTVHTNQVTYKSNHKSSKHSSKQKSIKKQLENRLAKCFSSQIKQLSAPSDLPLQQIQNIHETGCKIPRVNDIHSKLQEQLALKALKLQELQSRPNFQITSSSTSEMIDEDYESSSIVSSNYSQIVKQEVIRSAEGGNELVHSYKEIDLPRQNLNGQFWEVGQEGQEEDVLIEYLTK